jgi:hypothetical protein
MESQMIRLLTLALAVLATEAWDNGDGTRTTCTDFGGVVRCQTIAEGV